MSQWTSLMGHEINAANAAELFINEVQLTARTELEKSTSSHFHRDLKLGAGESKRKRNLAAKKFVQPKVPWNQTVCTAKDQWFEKGFFLILLEFSSFLWLSYKYWALLRKGDSGPIMTDFNKNCNNGSLRMRQHLKIIFYFFETSMVHSTLWDCIHCCWKHDRIKAHAIVDLAGSRKNERFHHHFNIFHLKVRESSCKWCSVRRAIMWLRALISILWHMKAQTQL